MKECNTQKINEIRKHENNRRKKRTMVSQCVRNRKMRRRQENENNTQQIPPNECKCEMNNKMWNGNVARTTKCNNIK